MRQATCENANLLILSDGGYRNSIPCSVGAFVIYAVFEYHTRPMVAQGFVLNGYTGSFPADAVALETAASYIADWVRPCCCVTVLPL